MKNKKNLEELIEKTFYKKHDQILSNTCYIYERHEIQLEIIRLRSVLLCFPRVNQENVKEFSLTDKIFNTENLFSSLEKIFQRNLLDELEILLYQIEFFVAYANLPNEYFAFFEKSEKFAFSQIIDSFSNVGTKSTLIEILRENEKLAKETLSFQKEFSKSFTDLLTISRKKDLKRVELDIGWPAIRQSSERIGSYLTEQYSQLTNLSKRLKTFIEKEF